ncbi:MAG: rRNA pseudouridine synthase [Puniceicoccales bacterium]|jgi:23S rRNA pseudouridine2605 synthase|nr:rRNA pseudouridine synthase [Puniceicoccales bacterium]
MSGNEPVRLQKFLSQAGVCSRRTAEQLIANGVVTVNGSPAVIGQSVTPEGDEVRINGEPVVNPHPARVVLLVNKPRGLLCTNLDPHGNRTVFELVPPEFATRKLFCVGRLDKDSEGMLLLTDDGALGNRVMHPSGGVIKRYRVTLNRAYDPALTPRLLKGAKDGDEILRFHKVFTDPRQPAQLEIHLAQGRKREIRRLLEIFGFFVKTLHRYQIGRLVMHKMPPGDCRKLSQKEIALLLKN